MLPRSKQLMRIEKRNKAHTFTPLLEVIIKESLVSKTRARIRKLRWDMRQGSRISWPLNVVRAKSRSNENQRTSAQGYPEQRAQRRPHTKTIATHYFLGTKLGRRRLFPYHHDHPLKCVPSYSLTSLLQRQYEM